jgi:membrane-associated phospholipid phosphatase
MQVALLCSSCTLASFAQSARPESSSTPAAQDQGVTAMASSATESDRASNKDESQNRLSGLPLQLAHDQLGIWSSPSRLRISDATWFVPLAGLTAAMLATDSDLSRHLTNDPSTLKRYTQISNYGLGAMAGVTGAAYLFGLASHNEHKRETGFLSGESALDSVLLVEATKYAAGRQRPYQDNGNGEFWHGGSSFPSFHSTVAWSVAGIVGHEYPNPFVKFAAYGLATAISASRIQAKQHFPSDVFVGGAIGWLTSAYVYHQHHDVRLTGEDWSLPAVRPDRPAHWQAKDMGSPYVPLDSWVYPAFDRLVASGFVHSGFLDMRPWTGMECARLVVEAQDEINEDGPDDATAARLYHSLQSEFEHEVALLGGGDNASAQLESVYTRSTEITGKPLTDGYHFAQTLINDYGRPYEEGYNNVSGGSAWAEDGPFAGYVRVEYQNAPAGSPLPLAAREAMAQEDFSRLNGFGISPASFIPPASATAASNVSHAQLLDSYVAMNLSDWQLSYGKQSLWWGPGRGGPMMLSDNAAPLNMFRVNRVTPFRLPGFLGFFGAVRVEFFIGQLSGYQFVLNPSGVVGQWGQNLTPQPIIHGERFSFRPRPRLEIGISRTTDYGGPGFPLTFRSFLRSVFSTGNTLAGSPNKPGDRRAGFDLTYQIRRIGSFYCDGFVEDTFSPLVDPGIAAWNSGLYLPRLPRLPKLDLRMEGVYTDLPNEGPNPNFQRTPGYFYYDSTWITGYQNDGHLLGSWIGRGGQGAQAWSDYWFDPKDKLEFSFRHQTVSRQFVPSGGNVTDAGVSADFRLRSVFSISAGVQYETWSFPVIATSRQNDITTMLQISIWPKTGLSRKHPSD